jgi:hypothetical protein
MGLGSQPDRSLEGVFSQHAASAELKSMSTARQGAALDLTYHVRLRPETSMLSFVADVNRVDGVMNVELKDA